MPYEIVPVPGEILVEAPLNYDISHILSVTQESSKQNPDLLPPWQVDAIPGLYVRNRLHRADEATLVDVLPLFGRFGHMLCCHKGVPDSGPRRSRTVWTVPSLCRWSILIAPLPDELLRLSAQIDDAPQRQGSRTFDLNPRRHKLRLGTNTWRLSMKLQTTFAE